MFLVLPLIITSYSSSDDDNDAKDSLIGAWICNKAYLDIDTNKDSVTAELQENDNVVDYESVSGDIYTFKDNGTVVALVSRGLVNGTYKIEGNKLSMTFYDEADDEYNTSHATYQIKNGKLYFSMDLTERVKNIRQIISKTVPI